MSLIGFKVGCFIVILVLITCFRGLVGRCSFEVMKNDIRNSFLELWNLGNSSASRILILLMLDFQEMWERD